VGGARAAAVQRSLSLCLQTNAEQQGKIQELQDKLAKVLFEFCVSQ